MEKASTLWKRFEKSGKLIDYLDFCKVRRREKEAPPEEREAEKPPQSSL